ncbi:MAG: GDSL-type esterase/lipase family protein [Phocaeicola sp.]
MKNVLLLCLLVLSSFVSATPHQVKIACVGNSITFGSGIKNRDQNSYPSQLQGYLGSNYEVINFGVGGTTANSKADSPYINTPAYKNSLDFQPDIVLIKLGTNDSKGWNMPFFDHFKADYQAIIDSYKEVNPRVRILLITPLRCYLESSEGIYSPRIREKFVPVIEQLAYENKLEVVDGHALFGSQFQWELMPDKLHPSSLGASIMAMNFDRILTMPRDNSYDIFECIDGGNAFNFHGFKGKEFSKDGLQFKIVQPKIANEKHSWVIRARFWGHEPQLDLKLLELGFHVVYCNVENEYGSPTAVKRWDTFYQEMVKLGLNKKVVLEGMSRGGLIVYNWAAKNTDKVSAIYADAPVMDLKSWPMGRGASAGSNEDVALMLKAYQMDREDEMLDYESNPIDHAAVFAEAQTAIIHVVGDVDEVVPVSENSALFQQRLTDLGGKMTVINKADIGHHPHSLSAPEPLVKFLLEAEGISKQYTTLPVPGSEFRSGAGWKEDTEWNGVAQQITEVLQRDSVDLLMLGNSITQGLATERRDLVTHRMDETALKAIWGPLRWESAGISGDRTQHLLWRIQNGNYGVSQPLYVTIAIGVNNILSGGDTPKDIYEGILEVTNAALKEFPTSRILLFGLLPTASSPKHLNSYLAIQSHLQATKFDARVIYVDPTPYFMNGTELREELYSTDKIHLQAEGYRTWAQLIKQTIETLSF